MPRSWPGMRGSILRPIVHRTLAQQGTLKLIRDVLARLPTGSVSVRDLAKPSSTPNLCNRSQKVSIDLDKNAPRARSGYNGREGCEPKDEPAQAVHGLRVQVFADGLQELSA
jgi:hypothetical protein